MCLPRSMEGREENRRTQSFLIYFNKARVFQKAKRPHLPQRGWDLPTASPNLLFPHNSIKAANGSTQLASSCFFGVGVLGGICLFVCLFGPFGVLPVSLPQWLLLTSRLPHPLFPLPPRASVRLTSSPGFPDQPLPDSYLWMFRNGGPLYLSYAHLVTPSETPGSS